jgi:subtilisin family serine protease
MRRIVFGLLGVLIASLPLPAQAGENPAEKIDAKVLQSMERRKGAPIPVALLLRTQLLETPGGFDAFCRENRGRRRSELRREVTARLREIADKTQPPVIQALGLGRGSLRLWILNAVLCSLTDAGIRKAAKMKSVKYIYPSDWMGPGWRRTAGGAAPKGVSHVLKPAKRRPFSIAGKKVPWNLREIGALRVWQSLRVTGEGAVVAMLDTGVNYRHKELTRNIWINPGEIPNNGKDDDGNGYVDDLYGFNFTTGSPEVLPGMGRGRGHGTMTSGIVAGDGSGGIITGVAPRARIMPLMGFGTTAALAYQYALANGADIVNMSFSIPGLGNTRGFWRMMSDHAVCAGLVLVSGAGNFQQSARIPVQIRIPEGIPSVICAGGVARDRTVPRFCSLGPVEWASVKFYGDHPWGNGKPGLIKPDVCGFPGAGYPVLDTRGDEGYVDPNNRYQGNSFSSPHISGIASLMLSANPELTAWRLRKILEKTATDVGPPGKDPRTGTGLANAFLAVREARAGAGGKGGLSKREIKALVRTLGRNWRKWKTEEKVAKILELSAIEADGASSAVARYGLRDADSRVRKTAAEILGEMGRKNAVPGLIAALKSGGGDIDVSVAIVRSLGKLGDPRAVPCLGKKWWNLGKSEEGYVLAAAKIDALGCIRCAASVDTILEIWSIPAGQHLVRVTSNIVASLGKLTGEDFKMDREAWKKWWKENRASFRFE